MNVYILNTVSIGEDVIEIINGEIKIKGIIGLSERGKTDLISDYSYQAHFCKKIAVDFIEIDSYSISKSTDKEKILSLDIDVLIVTGWQRLIPEWLIRHCTKCVIGSHGSPLGITKGRGRSPQNWALILGMKYFEISIFQIDKGIDSGRIFATKKFEYSMFDDIKTSYYKVCLLTSQMIIELLKTPFFLDKEYQIQSEDEAEYFPQRTPQDGSIDWNCTNENIRNFIRALTRPYPGATTYFEEHSIKIWEVIPFDIDIPLEKYQIGEIVKIFNKQDFLVRTKQSFLLVIDYDIEFNKVELKKGAVLESKNFTDQMHVIIDRHIKKYPALPVSKIIKTYANNCWI